LNATLQRLLVCDFGTLVLLVEQCVLFSCLSSGVHSIPFIPAIRFIRLQNNF
jgi:hypothetical protein